jgi:phosphatidylinositol alpha-1,6-mannosyltransferase
MVAPVSDRPRVLVLTPDFPPAHGGIQILVDRVVSHWTGLQPRVVTFDAPGADALDAGRSVDVRRIGRFPASRVAVGLLNARGLAEALRFRPEVVLCAHIATSPAAAAIARLLRAPYVQYLHAQEVAARPGLARFAIRHAAAVVAVSRFTEGLAMEHGADPTLVHLIHPGVDIPDARAVATPSEPPTVVIVARLEDRYKGHDVVLRALPLLRARIPNVRLAVVGDGDLRSVYEGFAESLGCRDAVDFLGAVDDATRDAVLQNARVFVMPSRLSPIGRGEGFGIVYLEAGARGLPVVAGNVAGTLDAVLDGETGVLVDPRDHLAVARAIYGLLESPEEARRLGLQGAARARELTWARASHAVEDILLGLVAARL